MRDDDAKRAILLRRAGFVASALVGLAGTTAACDGPRPAASPAAEPSSAAAVSSSAGPEPPPAVGVINGAGGTIEDLEADGGGAGFGRNGAPPHACLGASLPPRDAGPEVQGNVEMDVKLGAGADAPTESLLRARLMGRARACYRTFLRQDPTTAGRLVLAMHYDASGRVVTGQTVTNDGLPGNMVTCVMVVARTLVVPNVTSEGTITVCVDFTLRK